jgi:hypothetical protein
MTMRTMRLSNLLPNGALLALVVAAGALPSRAADRELPRAQYRILSANSLVDTKTGLEWTRAATRGFNFANAKTHCEGLVLDGKSDWRLPTVKEVASIFDPRLGSATHPYINATLFPETHQTAVLWSSTPLAGSSTYAWAVNFTMFMFTISGTNYMQAGTIAPLLMNSGGLTSAGLGAGNFSTNIGTRCVRTADAQ